MREQAKKMNVASLRSSESAQTSAECKLAKIALMTISLWFLAWTPYLVVNYTGIFSGDSISPLTTIWCSLFAKANAVYNPIVYGIRYVADNGGNRGGIAFRSRTKTLRKIVYFLFQLPGRMFFRHETTSKYFFSTFLSLNYEFT